MQWTKQLTDQNSVPNICVLAWTWVSHAEHHLCDTYSSKCILIGSM